MLTAPYVHFNNTRKPHHVSDGRGTHDNHNNNSNVMTMIDYTNLYIKNLDTDVTSYDLFKRFRVFGKIISARVMKDTITGKSKGYGFVSFTHIDEANEALQQMNGALVNTKNIVVTFHEHKKQINKQQQQQPQQQQSERNSHDLINLSSPTIIHNSYPSPQSTSYPNYGFIPEQHQHQQQQQHHVVGTKTVVAHNPWNETGIWMHNNKSPVVVPHHAYHHTSSSSTMHVPITTTTTTTTNASTTNNNTSSSTLVSPYYNNNTQQPPPPPQQQDTNVNSQIQYQKLRDAVYSQLSEYQQKDLNDLVDLIQSLKKRDLSLCLFNPTFLKQKIDEAYEALYLFQNNNNNNVVQPPSSMTTTPSLIHLNINEDGQSNNSGHSAAAAILTSLEGMTMNKKKRVFGDIFFPYVRATGVKHAPKVTIRLLDTVPLDELAFSMYDMKELTRKAQYAYSELYC